MKVKCLARECKRTLWCHALTIYAYFCAGTNGVRNYPFYLCCVLSALSVIAIRPPVAPRANTIIPSVRYITTDTVHNHRDGFDFILAVASIHSDCISLVTQSRCHIACLANDSLVGRHIIHKVTRDTCRVAHREWGRISETPCE